MSRLKNGKCRKCKWCVLEEKGKYICLDLYYGQNITDSMNKEKTCYSETLEDFAERIEREAEVFNDKTKLSQIKIDGRKNTNLICNCGNEISLKGTLVKKYLAEF